MDFHHRHRLSTSRFEADTRGVRVVEQGRLLELAWSAVRDVSLRPARRRRVSVRFELADGSALEPLALRRVTNVVGEEVQELWARYGFLGASAMWGRPAPAPGPALAPAAPAPPARPAV